MALSECVRSWNRWPPGLASQRLRTPNRTPRRSHAPSFAWRSRRIGVSTLGRGHCPSTSPGRQPTARCCPLGVVLGPGVHRLSQARAAGEWWQQSAAGSATARSARRNGRACGPAPAVGGAKGARAAAILRTPREDHSLGAVLADIGLWGVSSGQVDQLSTFRDAQGGPHFPQMRLYRSTKPLLSRVPPKTLSLTLQCVPFSRRVQGARGQGRSQPVHPRPERVLVVRDEPHL